MRVLLTGAATELGRLLAAGLRPDHDLRLTDAAELVTDLEFVRCDLGHDEATDHLVAGIDAIVYPVPAFPAGVPASAWLDASTRCPYNLLLAAVETGVRRAIVLSTLDIFRAYAPDLAVAEDWRPRPTCEAGELGPHLAEMTAREFAHSGRLEVAVLRLGHVVEAEAARRLPYDAMWVDGRDVVGAVRVALEQPLARFTVTHLQHRSARARFPVRRERPHEHRRPAGGPPGGGPPFRRWLDYTPQHNFEDHP